MKVIEVSSEALSKSFYNLPLAIYKNDTNWIQPLDKDIQEVFDPNKNKFFRHGECTRFILENEKGQIIGRIAAFINNRTISKEDQPTGGIGFFECIDNQTAANLLFDISKEWLKQRGMEAMDGPINFGERDAWWGLITKGFDPPIYKMNYNPAYYISLFENYGFKTWFEQWCFARKTLAPLQEKFFIRYNELSKSKDYRIEHVHKNQLIKYADDFRIIYNKAWAKHGGGKELEQNQVRSFFTKMKPVIDEKLIWFVYYENEPIAAWINLPDINQFFARFNGKFGWLEKLRFIWMLKRRKTKKCIGIVFGVIPEHQGKGVDALMIVECYKIIEKLKKYEDFEMQWIGDFNPKMVSIALALGTEKSRVLHTYRYLFDRKKEFKRHPILS